ncbi:baculoviral IAP repeat-containing protein 3-like [Neocloeon triangulifer]|uniref:baculoviral IAP repeat-containing protein 3-like n=1 Tax=Neocloeon triangulifer TaxID=2078957 RepID=UPI00286F522A|nr:baculoviral IAP repeat-containing protein 3-like [Neocloeon triangulifer]XP_059470740.1 baculoviral IAP repeat-containing protein 3-like [Neocloeon triangulifer]XP_059470741.1 baculoviral IAP repeat-containing protein 3-like [Neocloeon triangulifer]XP_059470742.1 baculoviral IAP repeat-containing protein 3-like [Neocloeon triangulifer]
MMPFMKSTDQAGAPIQNYVGHLNFKLELHRFFTFPVDFNTRFPVNPADLAAAGFYCSDSSEMTRLQCHFCPIDINVEEIQSKDILKSLIRHNCCVNSADSENIPLNDKQLDFKFEAHRLYSLLKKDDWKFVTPAELAKDGFYYTGEEDNCRCKFCNLEVRGWEEGDLVRSEHQRWNSGCQFLQNPSSVQNIPIGQELDQRESLESCSRTLDSVTSGESREQASHKGFISKISGTTFPFTSVKDLLKKYGPNATLRDPKVSPLSLNIQGWSKSSHLRYSTVAGRLKTFRNWPKSLNQKPESLALAGFFYTGRGDRVICFHCNLGLKDWACQDDPLEQHERWNAACQYLIMAREKKIDAENRRGSVLCVKCEEESVSRVNLPCGHAHLCATCSDDDCCATCGNNVYGHVNFFL